MKLPLKGICAHRSKCRFHFAILIQVVHTPAALHRGENGTRPIRHDVTKASELLSPDFTTVGGIRIPSVSVSSLLGRDGSPPQISTDVRGNIGELNILGKLELSIMNSRFIRPSEMTPLNSQAAA
jgi:hypothetical protein